MNVFMDYRVRLHLYFALRICHFKKDRVFLIISSSATLKDTLTVNDSGVSL